jgi:oxygen-dependent protoporphyrinogen oxidase
MQWQRTKWTLLIVSASVLVVGSGISGLVAAHELLKSDPTLELQVLEGGQQLGGNMTTERVDGFVFERGPHGFQASAGATEVDSTAGGDSETRLGDGLGDNTVALVRELGLGGRLLPSALAAKRRYLYSGGKLVALSPKTLLFSRLLPTGARLRLLGEPFCRAPPPAEEESVAAFGRRRLGQRATATLLDPVVTGVYGGDVERLSLRAAFPRLAQMEEEHGSLYRAIRKMGRAPRLLYSFPDGLGELVEAFRQELGERVRLGEEVISVEAGSPGFSVGLRSGGQLAADSVIVATPAPRAAGLFSAARPELARALEAMPYAPIVVLCLGYGKEAVGHALDGFGFLVPRSEGLRSLGAIWSSAVYPQHAPDGAVSLRVLLGGAHDPEIVGATEEELRSLVERELGPALGLKGAPLLSRVYRYPLGIPQYNLGHEGRLARIDEALRELPGLYLTGNAYRGVGINDCVLDGARVALQAADFLRGASAPDAG